MSTNDYIETLFPVLEIVFILLMLLLRKEGVKRFLLLLVGVLGAASCILMPV